MNQIRSLLERWVKSLENLYTGFAIVGFILVGLGGYLNIERMTNLGFAAWGAGVIAWGANTIQTREFTVFQRGIRMSERIEEVLARVWGILFVGGGLLLLGYGILAVLNPRAPLPIGLRGFFETLQGKGVLLFAASAIGVLFSVTMILVSDVQGSNAFIRFIKGLPGRLFGVALLLFFGALATISVIQIFAPDAWETLFQSFLRMLGFV